MGVMAQERTGEAEDDAPNGRTRWAVFALVLVVGALGAGLMLTGMFRGALAASFTVSGTSYKATADKLVADGVVQFGAVDRGADEAHPVLVNGFRRAKLTNFCQSIVVADVPVFGAITIRMEAPGGMRARNLVLGVQQVRGDLTLTDVQIGRDAGSLDAGPPGVAGSAGEFGIQASGMTVTDLRQEAWSTTASTLSLTDANISAVAGRKPCF